jgi:hypothetical protein
MKTIEQVKEYIKKSLGRKEESKNSIRVVLALRLILTEIRTLKEILDYIDSEETK